MGDRREVPRYIAEFHAQVIQPPDEAPLQVKVVSLSISGCSAAGARLMKLKQAAELAFEWEGTPFRAKISVVWKSHGGEVGIRFLDMDQESEELLRKICAKLRLQPRGPLPTDTP